MAKDQLRLEDAALATDYVKWRSANPNGREVDFAKSQDIAERTWFDKKGRKPFQKLLEDLEGAVIARMQVQAVSESILNKGERQAIRQEIVNELLTEFRSAGIKDGKVSIAPAIDNILKSAAIETGEWNEKVKTEGLVTVEITESVLTPKEYPAEEGNSNGQ